ncbi:MAG: hypothetical protein LBD40_00715 [Puniceicoccales bacterium]|jgi:hypothetical protein|nr:hypothetical protein [Puniceicoccales bacterium]
MNISSRDHMLLGKLLRAFRTGKLAHAFIVSATDLDYSRTWLTPLAQAILDTQDLMHPDWLQLKPSGSMAQIKTEEVRLLVQRVQQTALAGIRKVVWIEDAERCPPSAANIFLKTLEEAPPQTYFFLLSSHPSQLLSTIRSRCFIIRLQGIPEPICLPLWEDWKRQLSDILLALLADHDRQFRLIPIPQLYALLASLENLVSNAMSQTSVDTEAPEGTPVHETAQRSLQRALWSDLEHFIANILYHQGNTSVLKRLPAIVAFLEKCHGLSELNLPFTSTIEACLIFTAQILAQAKVEHSSRFSLI